MTPIARRLARQTLQRLAATAAVAMTLALPAQAGVLTFDELQPPSGGYQPVVNGYAQLNWSNFNVLDGSSIPNSGYSAGIVSGHNVIYNSAGNPAEISRASGFALDSAYFTAAWYSGMTIVARGFVDDDNNADFVSSFVVGDHAPTLVNFGWTGLSRVSFGAAQPGFGQQFAIDNLSIDGTQAVPEPASAALALLGLAAALAVGARRQRRG